MNIATQAQIYFDTLMAGKSSPKWLEKFIGSQLPIVVTLLLILLVSRQAANFTWSLIPAPDTPYNVPPVSAVRSTEQISSQTDLDRLDKVAELHLFGVAGAPKAAAKVDAKAPETHLNLTLHGVFVADDPKQGAAIISTGSVQKYHKVGGAVMSGVTLQAVFSDRVVLLRNGQSEVLRFPKVKQSSLLQSSSVSSNRSRGRIPSNSRAMLGPGSPASSRGANLSRYRDMLREEPLKIFEHVRFVPVKSRDGMKGYRILPQKNRALYNQLGVRPSDLVTAVNGVSLTNDKEAMKLIDQLKDAQSLQVDIIRNGQPRSLSFDLN
jgi:general secretion pathway protein C